MSDPASGQRGVMRLAAVGSPHGDDRIGWHVVEQLRREGLNELEAVCLDNALTLLDLLPGCELLLVLDACRSGSVAGTIMRLAWPDPRLWEDGRASTHGFGVVAALELAAALELLPPRVVLIGVEGEAWGPGEELSPPVQRAAPELCRLVLEEWVRGDSSVRAKRSISQPYREVSHD